MSRGGAVSFFFCFAVCAVVVAGGCNRRVFEFVEPVCGATDVKDVAIDDGKVDVLVVVDNSNSMQEEQDEVARNFLNDDPACPIAPGQLGAFRSCDTADDDERPAVCRFLNPSDLQLATDLKDCGFLQVLAAYNVDFRVGVITTDVGSCDNRIPEGQGGSDWGFRPQRGCLQPDSPFGARKIIARDDVDSADPVVSDIARRFSETLLNVRTFGSPVERGFDAVDLFFDPATARPAACANDAADFLRDDARLAVIFLSDEEDCSHVDAGPFDDAGGRLAEFDTDVCGPNQSHFELASQHNCYDSLDQLTPVSEYVNRFRRLKADPADVSVAVIAGGVVDGAGGVVAGGCDVGEDGLPAGGCAPLRGGFRADCPDCCLADGGGRYFALADAIGGIKDSICNASFRNTMIDIAARIGAVDVVRFSAVPANVDVIIVEKNGERVERIHRDDGVEACGATDDGWLLLADQRSVKLCGAARPAAGDSLVVRAPLPGKCEAPLEEN